MNDKRVGILIAVLTGLGLTALLLLAGYHTAGASLRPPIGPEHSLDSSGASGSASEWNSGWVTVAQGTCQIFNHNLGGNPDNYAVELWFLDTDEGIGINHANYGGMEVGGDWHGGNWQHLTANTVQVCRQANDRGVDQLRVQVSIPPGSPDFVSPWTNILPGQTIVFTHGLAITDTDLTVNLWFSGTTRGIHHFSFGGLAVDGPQLMLGAHWYNLSANTVQVTRHPDDTDIEQVRVTVVHGAEPAYDSLEDLSGWRFIARGTEFTFTHNLNWNPDMLLVRGECFSSTLGIHQLLAGGNHDWFVGWQGAHLQNLTENTVRVVRRQDDQICPLVRVRVWRRSTSIYLPFVVRDY